MKEKIEEPYKNLFRYCIDKEDNDGKVKECRVLLDNLYQNSAQETCLEIVLPAIEPSERHLEFCLDTYKISQWSNPYRNYDLDIPVIIEVDYKDFPVINIENLNIELMSDEEAHKIIDPVNQKTNQIILFRSIVATKEIEEKGYYVTNRIFDLSTGEEYPVLGVYEVEITDLSFEEENFILKIKMKILGVQKEEEIKFDSVQFEKYSYSNVTQALKREILDANSNLEKEISIGEIYLMEFSIQEHEEFSDSLIERYSVGDTTLDFMLEKIIYYVD